jgi:hypothetical protein
MTEDFKLDDRAHAWIKGMRSRYQASALDEGLREAAPVALEAGAFKIL